MIQYRAEGQLAEDPTATKSLAGIRHVALDLDGTIYRGTSLFEATIPFLALLEQLGIGHTFLTNNPSKSTGEYLAHLRGFGIPAMGEQICTSTHATIDFLKLHWPQVQSLFVLGTAGLCEELANAGFSQTADNPEDHPDAVLVGFDTTLTYARLCRAAWWIKQGRPYFATNPDRVCPTDQPTVLVDCGSITAALERATGIAPQAVFGKPDPAMLHAILRRHGLAPAQLAMVGDRLYTDMEMARRTGALGVLVLTGETQAAEVARLPSQPDLVVPTLAEFGERLRREHSKMPRP